MKNHCDQKQIDQLLDWLAKNNYNLYPSKEEKVQIASLTNMTSPAVARWFANLRRKLKTKVKRLNSHPHDQKHTSKEPVISNGAELVQKTWLPLSAEKAMTSPGEQMQEKNTFTDCPMLPTFENFCHGNPWPTNIFSDFPAEASSTYASAILNQIGIFERLESLVEKEMSENYTWVPEVLGNLNFDYGRTNTIGTSQFGLSEEEHIAVSVLAGFAIQNFKNHSPSTV